MDIYHQRFFQKEKLFNHCRIATSKIQNRSKTTTTCTYCFLLPPAALHHHTSTCAGSSSTTTNSRCLASEKVHADEAIPAKESELRWKTLLEASRLISWSDSKKRREMADQVERGAGRGNQGALPLDTATPS